ncbi:hypothetical protein FA95DRAFT_1548916 [Auriscalpium vulgare]|uniref:Uncharacterized protein n=1 Tax=Auriscalpium vulgare TaxID=40419 RepID=A0ACB8RBS9_9AGAM|nr:hypothetical protein FA95DRAFT_1548916 [Auriscalpium vulgare]
MSEESITACVDRPRLDDEHPGRPESPESWWKIHHDWLAASGYDLQRRHHPLWTRPWRVADDAYVKYEDGQANIVILATRTSDGKHVALKRFIPTSAYLEYVRKMELSLMKYLCMGPLAADPRNGCVPVLDILDIPNADEEKLLVMPVLRRFDDPEFETYGEAVAFFSQIFEAVKCLHEHLIAHRDLTLNSIRMDASRMYPESLHPGKRDHPARDWKGKAKRYTRTQKPPRYHLVNFGLSRPYDRDDWPFLELPDINGDTTVPEHSPGSLNTSCDPFATDTYTLGNVIRARFITRSKGFEFMVPLVDDMVAHDPTKRPTMEEVIERFRAIRQSLGKRILRARIVRKEECFVVGLWRSVGYWNRRIGYTWRKISAIPDYA